MAAFGSASSGGDGTLASRPMIWHTGARVFEVVTASGRRRFVLLVRCPYCPDLHSMSTYELKPTLRRCAMCGLGHVIVHTHADEVVAA